MRDLLSDLTYALRICRRSAGFSLVATLTVALGIGAGVTVFSVVNAALLAPLPYPQSDRIVSVIQQARPGIGFTDFPSARITALFYAQQAQSFDAIGAFKGDFFDLTDVAQAERVDGVRAPTSLRSNGRPQSATPW